MRVLVISPVFPPEPIISARTTADIAGELGARGHKVTVITAFPNRPAGELYPEYHRALYRRERATAGYTLLRCFSTLSRESRLISRLAENLSFGLTSGLALLTARRPGVVYANSWPIVATGILALITHLRHIPLIISVQDIYPDSLISQGRLQSSSLLARLLTAIDRWIAQRCRAMIVISERFAAVYQEQRGVHPSKLHVVPNWTDQSQVSLEDGFEIRQKMGIPENAFLLVYGGNIGAAAGVEGVIEAFGDWPPDAMQPHLLIAGAGARLEACRTLAARLANNTIHFLTPWPSELTDSVYRAADVLVLPTHGNQSLVSVPSKLISYMLAGRPVLAQALPGSDVTRMVEEANCGWVVRPEGPSALAANLREIIALPPEERSWRGQSGREYALRHMTRATCLPKVINLLEQVAETGSEQHE